MEWYYVDAERQTGPVSEAEFESLVSSGRIRPETQVWHEGMAEWRPYRETAAAGTRASLVSDAAAPGALGLCCECGRTLPLDEMIRHGELRVCAACKPVFVQRLREGARLPGAMEYASFWTRAAARIIDWVILIAANIAIALLLGVPIGAIASSGENELAVILAGQVMVTAISLAIALGYVTWMIGKYGATLGKMALGIIVIRADGGRVSYARALGRYFAEILSGMTCFIGYLIAAFDDEVRTLHDHICNTRVVKK